MKKRRGFCSRSCASGLIALTFLVTQSIYAMESGSEEVLSSNEFGCQRGGIWWIICCICPCLPDSNDCRIMCNSGDNYDVGESTRLGLPKATIPHRYTSTTGNDTTNVSKNWRANLTGLVQVGDQWLTHEEIQQLPFPPGRYGVGIDGLTK
jgi:hypothetical protein